MRSFRASWRHDWRTRAIDRMCHIIAGATLPGPWWFQFLPDLMVIPMMIISLTTNQFLKSTNVLVAVSKALHNLGWVILWFSIYMCDFSPNHYKMNWAYALGVQWAVHLIIDMFTHRRWRQYESEL